MIGALAAVTAGVVLLDATVGLPGGVLGGRLLDGGTSSAAPAASPRPAVSPVPAETVLEPSQGATAPDPAALAAVLDPILTRKALGGTVSLTVVDLATGDLLFDRTSTSPRTPASTAKILTASAALELLGGDARLTTKVVRTPPAAGGDPAAVPEIVLVGGGDPSLRAVPGGGDPSLRVLAKRTAEALATSGVEKVRLRYDASLFAPPTASPAWPASYVASGVVAPVTALSVDDARQGDPSRYAAETFRTELVASGIAVRGGLSSVRAGTSAPEVARVQSRPVAMLVDQMLTTSDNDYAEAFGHLAAVAAGEPATFEGGAAATLAAVAGLGVRTTGVQLFDASGLARSDRAPAATLAAMLSVAGAPGREGLRPVVTGLPVAGFTGTLADRFLVGAARAGAGVVRAKTGTLTGVSALAGTVLDREGRVLAFAFLVDRTADGGASEVPVTLDRAAAALATCGCR
ncbi:MAG TPA: D-alanyl-D-alanine carboxypeptidase/D-alanyl-D-alanine-endopeptidase [Candidatus Limnocylindria bacterium]|nr:D-alanyl-D-alanine carboxypeptidase/D-alanyl-D-alanine-endopeptidase [Candidatus Limnocylindria bacterium]